MKTETYTPFTAGPYYGEDKGLFSAENVSRLSGPHFTLPQYEAWERGLADLWPCESLFNPRDDKPFPTEEKAAQDSRARIEAMHVLFLARHLCACQDKVESARYYGNLGRDGGYKPICYHGETSLEIDIDEPGREYGPGEHSTSLVFTAPLSGQYAKWLSDNIESGYGAYANASIRTTRSGLEISTLADSGEEAVSSLCRALAFIHMAGTHIGFDPQKGGMVYAARDPLSALWLSWFSAASMDNAHTGTCGICGEAWISSRGTRHLCDKCGNWAKQQGRNGLPNTREARKIY